MRALAIIGGLFAAGVLLFPVPGYAVSPGHERCDMARVHHWIGEDLMRFRVTCNTGMVAYYNRLATRSEVLDRSVRCHRSTIRVHTTQNARSVMLRYVYTCSSGIVMYSNMLR